MTLQEFTLESFDQSIVQAKALAVVNFWADWCGPCQLQQKVLLRLAADAENPKSVLIGRVDVDRQEELARRFGITTLPTTLLFAEGSLVEALVGFQAEEYLKGYLEFLVKSHDGAGKGHS